MSQQPNEQEKKDLEILKAEIQKEKLSCYDYCVSILRWPDDQLKHTGHKSKEAAVLWSVQNSQKKIEKLTQAHIRKYPD